MYIKGKWLEEPEVNAYVRELEGKIEKQSKFLHCIRAYYEESISWVDLFEEDFQNMEGLNDAEIQNKARHLLDA